MAQNVTIYGIVDMGYHNEKSKFADGADSFTLKRQGLNSVVAGSRIGLRGTEDLGGGLKAGFVLEYAITPDENAGIGTGASPNRQSFVSLGGGFGEIRLGRQLTLHHVNQGAGDLLGNLNAQAGYIGGLDSLVRASNAITYTSPAFNGFTVAAQKAFGETRINSEDANEKLNEQTAVRLSYAAGPLAAGFATETTKNWDVAQQTAASADATVFVGLGHLLNDTDVDARVPAFTVDKRRANNLFATYNFGVAQVGFVNNNTKFTTDGESVKWTANTLTVAVPMGATTLHASIGNGKVKVADEPNMKARAYQLGAQYAFSKRTSAYFYTGQSKFSVEDTSAKYNTYSVGVRHNF